MITIALFLLVACLSGCTTFDNFKGAFIDDPEDTADAINIGVYEPMAGADKEDAAPEISGIELAHKLHPKVNGKDVNLVYADNNSDLTAAETAITTLLSKNPTVILGSYGNLYSLLASEYTEEAKVPAIAMTNTNPLVTRNNSFYFRICYIDSTQGRLLANYLNSIKVKEIGVMLPEGDDAAMAMATSFTNYFEDMSELDDTVGFYEKFTTGATDFTEQLDILKESGVKYVLLPGQITDAANIINQAAKMDLDVTFLGDMTWGDDAFRKGLSNAVDPTHLAFVQFFATDGNDRRDVVSEARQTFLDAYYKDSGTDQEPDEAVALGYDAYMLALDAIEKATDGNSDIAGGEAIRDLMLSDDYQFEGASGTIQFNKTGDPKKTAYISTFANDTITALYTIETKDQ